MCSCFTPENFFANGTNHLQLPLATEIFRSLDWRFCMELHIDKKIKEYRRKEDLTQEELAKILGVSHQSVSKWEQGDGYPDITLLPVIANHFGITIDELVGNDEIGRKEELAEYRKKFNSQPGGFGNLSEISKNIGMAIKI